MDAHFSRIATFLNHANNNRQPAILARMPTGHDKRGPGNVPEYFIFAGRRKESEKDRDRDSLTQHDYDVDRNGISIHFHELM